MSLRLKVAFILLISVVALISILLITAYSILLPSYAQLEQDYLRQDTRRVVARLESELGSLSRFLLDWSSWDDTYAFVANPTAVYLSSNLVESTFINSRLTAVVMANEAGELVYQGFYDHEAEEMVASLPTLEALLYELETGLLRPIWRESGQATFLTAPSSDTLFILASQPILDSSEAQPPRGTMIMVRALDEEWLEQMAAQMQTEMSLSSWGEVVQTIDPAIWEALLGADPESDPLVVVGERNESYALLRNVRAEPTAVLSITAERTIYNSGVRTLYTFILLTVGIGLMVMMVLVYLLNTQLIDRIITLERGVVHVRETEDLEYRLPDHGRDEIATLGQQINRLLVALHLAQQTQQLTADALRTERQQLEARVQQRTQELAQSNERLRQLDASKSQFINDISHEFRTPVTNLRLYLDLWQRGHEAHKARYLEVIERQMTRLMKLSESVQRLAEVEFAADECAWELRSLEETVAPLVQKYQELAEPRGIKVSSTAVSTPPLWHCPDLIRTLFDELLENSLHYSEQGSIQLILQPYATPDGTTGVQIEVRDEGMGIAPDDLPHVQERFYRGRGAGESNRPGIGVGLTMVYHIVALHKGEMQIESEQGKGTAVVIHLPHSS